MEGKKSMNTMDIRHKYSHVVNRLRESVKARRDWYVEYNEHVYSREEIFYFEFIDKCIEDDIKQLQLAIEIDKTSKVDQAKVSAFTSVSNK